MIYLDGFVQYLTAKFNRQYCISTWNALDDAVVEFPYSVPRLSFNGVRLPVATNT